MVEIASSSLSEIADSAKTHAWRYYHDEDYDNALSLFQKMLEEGNKRDGYYGLGLVLAKRGNVVRSVKSLINAIKCDPSFHEAFVALGDIYATVGQIMPAAENYGQAVALDSDNLEYKQKLIHVLSAVALKKVNPNLKGVLTECLETDEVPFPRFGKTWCSIATDDKRVAAIYKLRKHKNYSTFKKGMDSFPTLDGLMDQFFLLGFGKFIVPDRDFERWCTFLRRYILEAVSEGKTIFSDADYLDFMTCALSKYCAFTDYIFSISENENVMLDTLREKIEDGSSTSLSDLACLGCYIPLYSLKNAQEIERGLEGGDHVSQIPKSQIADYFTQQEIKKDIPVLGKIEDNVSLGVQAQYEEFPYPRWEFAVRDIYNSEIEGHLKDAKAKILVAGCGTGQEAMQFAYAFPDAEITAVDLSSTSLAYAIFKARQLGIENIKFMQADILNLGEIETRFDFITSSGVLHHMDDPKHAWSILKGLLKPDGLMRVALYSRQARWAVNDARKVIEEKNLGTDAFTIQAFRDNITEHLKHRSIENLTSFYDYYSLSECRDLMFHVQEHQFDLLQINDILDEFDMEFLKFHISEQEIQRYVKRNADDPDAKDLVKWAEWEDNNQNLFVAMYTFWCKAQAS